MKGIDWNKVGKELLPRAALARTDEQFGLLVEELVARLEDSHAVVQAGSAKPPAPDLPQWDPGLACLIDDRGRPVVYVVEPGSPALRAGVRPGMTVVAVNGVSRRGGDPPLDASGNGSTMATPASGTLRYDAARGFLQQQEKGARVTIVLEDADGRKTVVDAAADLKPRIFPACPCPGTGSPTRGTCRGPCSRIGSGTSMSGGFRIGSRVARPGTGGPGRHEGADHRRAGQQRRRIRYQDRIPQL